MTHWLAEGDTPDGPRSVRLSGETVLDAPWDQRRSPVVRVGDGPPDPLPSPLLPDHTDRVPDLLQAKPADRISAWVRLWILGVLERHPGWDGVICATYGDVTHWIEVSAAEAVSSRSSVTLRLCRVMQGSEEIDAEALAASISRPERLAADLRAAEVAENKSAITGHLLGAELAAMRPYWLGREVVLATDQPTLYATSLIGQSVPVTAYRPEALLSEGLASIARARGFSQ